MARGLIVFIDDQGRHGIVQIASIQGWALSTTTGRGLQETSGGRPLQITQLRDGLSQRPRISYPISISIVSGVGMLVFNWDASGTPGWTSSGSIDGPLVKYRTVFGNESLELERSIIHTQDVGRINGYIRELRISSIPLHFFKQAFGKRAI